MKLAHLLVLAFALLVFTTDPAAASEADPFSSYTLLYSSNVAGETEPCG